MKEIIESVNKEKQILTTALSQLGSRNEDICTRGSITRRLTQLDNFLLKLVQKEHLTV
jgi:hypothetical protein